MDIRITGRNVKIGKFWPHCVDDGLSCAVSKYFARQAEARVIFKKENGAVRSNCSVHLSSGITLRSKGEGDNARAAFHTALRRLENRVHRYKERIRNRDAAGRDKTRSGTNGMD